MSQADKIRVFIKKNYIDPAREKGKDEITIKAGEVNNRMVNKGLLPTSRVPNVNNALGGKKLEKRCNINLKNREGPPQSTTTEYTYEIMGTSKSNQKKSVKKKPAANSTPIDQKALNKHVEKLKERLAKGEISIEEYREIKNELEK